VAEHVDENRQCAGEDECCADAHQATADDQLLGGVGECCPGREHAEQHHADLHHELATEAIAETAAGKQQAGKHERVGVDNPLQSTCGCFEFAGQSGDGHVDDEVVDYYEKHREAENRKNPPAARMHLGVGVGGTDVSCHVDTV
jgi:hypothetical protein